MKKKRKKRKIPSRKREISYSPARMSAVDKHISENFGEITRVLCDTSTSDIHIDICIVPPDVERPYWKLVTVGMGAYKMRTNPADRFVQSDRIELVMAVHPNMNLEEFIEEVSLPPGYRSIDPNPYWPSFVLEDLAKVPLRSHSYFAPFHTIDMVNHFSDQTKLSGMLIYELQDYPQEAQICTLPDGEEVAFYQAIPIYRSEMNYILRHDFEEKQNLIAKLPYIAENKRPRVV